MHSPAIVAGFTFSNMYRMQYQLIEMMCKYRKCIKQICILITNLSAFTILTPEGSSPLSYEKLHCTLSLSPTQCKKCAKESPRVLYLLLSFRKNFTARMTSMCHHFFLTFFAIERIATKPRAAIRGGGHNHHHCEGPRYSCSNAVGLPLYLCRMIFI